MRTPAGDVLGHPNDRPISDRQRWRQLSLLLEWAAPDLHLQDPELARAAVEIAIYAETRNPGGRGAFVC